MRALVQRVTMAQVEVGSKLIGQCGAGLLIFVCAIQGDTEADAMKLASRISKLRIFRDENGKMNRSLLQTNGSALVVSQFTLAGDTSRGNRPGFSLAAAPDRGEQLYLYFVDALRELGVVTETGQFGADMAVSLINDGPVTLWLDT